jgi:hypothetical protein
MARPSPLPQIYARDLNRPGFAENVGRERVNQGENGGSGGEWGPYRSQQAYEDAVRAWEARHGVGSGEGAAFRADLERVYGELVEAALMARREARVLRWGVCRVCGERQYVCRVCGGSVTVCACGVMDGEVRGDGGGM